MKNAKKRVIALLLCLVLSLAVLPAAALAADGVGVNAANFPDASFRSYVSMFDKDRDGRLSNAERAKVTEIYVAGRCISSLKGVEHFPALTVLDCSWNNLVNLNVTQNKALLTLNCNGNKLTKLNVTKNTELQTLYCENNKLTALDVTANKFLNVLSCVGNSISKLNIKNNPRLNHAFKSGTKYAYGSGYCYSMTQYGGGVAVVFSLAFDTKTKLETASAKPPVITVQPKGKCVGYGKTATYTVEATGEGLTYQWYVSEKSGDGGTKLEGETGSKLTVKATKSTDGNKYFCVVSGKGGVVYSHSATVGIIPAPVISSQPRSAVVKEGVKVLFKVKATGSNLRYRWYYQKPGVSGWKAVSSSASGSLVVTAKAVKNGYKYRCLVWNGGGSVYSKSVRLTVQ